MSDRPQWFERDIIAPANRCERDAVRVVQRVLRVPETGEMDAATATSLRGVQQLFGLPVTGIIDAATAARIDAMRPWQLEGEKPCRPY